MGEATGHIEDDGIGDDDEEATNMTIDNSSENTAVMESPGHQDYKKIWSLVEAADCVDEDC